MRRSTRHALAVGFVFILAALCVAVPSVHAATEDSREKDEMLLNDAAAEGEQGMNKLLHWAIGVRPNLLRMCIRLHPVQ